MKFHKPNAEGIRYSHDHSYRIVKEDDGYAVEQNVSAGSMARWRSAGETKRLADALAIVKRVGAARKVRSFNDVLTRGMCNPTPQCTHDFRNTRTAYLVARARSGSHRIKCEGKTVWGGVGNPSGLGSYFQTIAEEKWAKSGARFEKKLLKLTGEVEVFEYRNVTRDRGRWVAIKKFDLPAVK